MTITKTWRGRAGVATWPLQPDTLANTSARAIS
jgi:hypothetical protein